MNDRNYSTEDFELVDLYISFNSIEAQFIKDMLDANDIANFIRDLDVAAFPTHIGTNDQHRIVVEDDKLEAAVALIKQAIEDEAITDEGRFVFEDPETL